MALEFNKQLEELREDYARRKVEEARIWQGFEEKSELVKKVVEQEFRRVADLVLKEREKYSVEIGKVRVTYDFNQDWFDLNVQGGKVIKKGQRYEIGRNACAYIVYDRLIGYIENPRIKQFKKDFKVNWIHTACYCGSDHK